MINSQYGHSLGGQPPEEFVGCPAEICVDTVYCEISTNEIETAWNVILGQPCKLSVVGQYTRVSQITITQKVLRLQEYLRNFQIRTNMEFRQKKKINKLRIFTFNSEIVNFLQIEVDYICWKIRTLSQPDPQTLFHFTS